MYNRQVDRNIRRVIKFDDQNLDLMLDVRINDKWRRVRPPEAQAAKMANSFSTSVGGPEELSSINIADFFANPRTPAGSWAWGRPRSPVKDILAGS